MAEMPRDRIYVGAQGHVVALEGASGREVWRTKVRGRGFERPNRLSNHGPGSRTP